MTNERLKELIRCVAVAKKYITDDGGDSYLSFNETDELLAHIHTLEQENGRLREVLEKCGLHAPDCHAKLDQDEWVGCDCGLDAALAPSVPATTTEKP